MGDIKKRVVALQGHPVSPTAPQKDQILKYDGAEWMPTDEDTDIKQIDGYGINEFSGTGTILNFTSTEEVLGSQSNTPFKQFVANFTGINADYNSLVSYNTPTGIQNWNVSVVGLDRDNNDNFYKSELNFLVINKGFFKVMTPTAPTGMNLITGGDGYSWNTIATLISGNAHIQAQGFTGTNWSVYGTVQELITESVPSSLFLPSNLPDLIVWLSTDSGITLSGGNVVSWTDQSVENNDVSQENTELQPTYNEANSNYNNQPTILFDGSQYLNSIGAHTYNQPNTVIMCGNWSGSPSDNHMVGTPIDGSRNDLFAHTSTQIGLFGNGGIAIEESGSSSIENPSVIAGIFNSTASSGFVNDSQNSVVSGDILSVDPWTPLEIGGTLNGENTSIGTVAEVIAYNRILSSDELQQIFQYLGQKYNISVS